MNLKKTLKPTIILFMSFLIIIINYKIFGLSKKMIKEERKEYIIKAVEAFDVLSFVKFNYIIIDFELISINHIINPDFKKIMRKLLKNKINLVFLVPSNLKVAIYEKFKGDIVLSKYMNKIKLVTKFKKEKFYKYNLINWIKKNISIKKNILVIIDEDIGKYKTYFSKLIYFINFPKFNLYMKKKKLHKENMIFILQTVYFTKEISL